MADQGFTINNQGRGILRVEGIGDVPLTDIQSFLESFQSAYAGLAAFETLTDSALVRIGPLLADSHGEVRSIDIRKLPVAPIWDEMARRFSSPNFRPVELVTPQQALVLKSVRLQSPGFWDFLGKLNPLEVIRQFLNDLHEHRKDRDYREAAEKRRLYLSNLALENDVLKARIGLARSLGASNADLAPLVNHLIVTPLNQLSVHQGSGLITTATVRLPEADAENQARTF